MTPTLIGRLQTRAIVVLIVGLCWTIVVTPFLPVGGMALGDVYNITIQAVIGTVLLGLLIWEPLYHFLQQYRWEKDWPTLFGLITSVPEGVVVWLLLRAGVPIDVGAVDGSTFLAMFVITWIAIWLVANGPLQIVFIRWRFRGGRFL